MSSITNMLAALPDEAARMRVMRWAFGRFSDELKRPDAAGVSPAARPAPLAFAPKPQPVGMSGIGSTPQRRVPLARPQPIVDDFGEQIAELEALLPPRREDPYPEV
jgi:hypothetical protein